MKKVVLWLALASAALIGSATLAPSGQAVTVNSQSSFGTIASGSTICVGNLAPTNTQGVQITGFTNAQPALKWQVLTVSSQSAPTVVFETTARSVNHTVAPLNGNFLYQACVVKSGQAAQDYTITLNSQPVG
jgi:hypothetical protein